MEDRRRGAVGELREDEAELEVGSAWAEVVWRCGATVSFECAGVRAAAAMFWGFWAGSGRESEGIGLRGFQ